MQSLKPSGVLASTQASSAELNHAGSSTDQSSHVMRIPAHLLHALQCAHQMQAQMQVCLSCRSLLPHFGSS
jgi:hypothetical protein